MEEDKYYIGLDCGTSSVGWAVTDSKYNLLQVNGKIKKDDKIKTKKRTLWGVRLFDEADTAAERRAYRSARRRNQRMKERLKLLRLIFRDEMIKVAPDFYQRLDESFYYEEDKRVKSKNTLFNDPDFTDKDFHRLYPTIWHLRQKIVKASDNEHFDLRLYFLAIQHIYKHRGHFLLNGKLENNQESFEEIFDAFYNASEAAGYALSDSIASELEQLILDKEKSKLDKKKEVKELIFIEGDSLDEDSPKGQSELAGLIVGSKVSLKKIFNLDIDEDFKYSFAEGVFEDKLPEIEAAIGSENLDLIYAAKQIYDYAVLQKLLGGKKLVCDAMVANYDQHEKDLMELKNVFRPHKEIYHELFKVEKYDKKKHKFDADKNPSYAAYVGKACQVEGGREGRINIDQETFNKRLRVLLERIDYHGELLERAERGELLPKQRGQAKGTIPQQLHHNELVEILKKLAKDFPSFSEENPDEDETYNTKCLKLAKIHDFRRPYYCGPLVKRLHDEKGRLVPGGKSDFSWADEEISELVRPWNFDKILANDKDKLAENFIERMTNECAHLLGEKVLPKESMLYQRYLVLNELNNLRIDGKPLDISLKQKVFDRAFCDIEINGNITLRKLEKWLKETQLIPHESELGGTNENKFLPKLKTRQDFRRILGADFEKKYSLNQLEEIVRAITILGDEKKMLQSKIAKILKLNSEDDQVRKLAKLSYKGWGRFSDRFLAGVTVQDRTILDWLYETQFNLQQLLGQEVGFGKRIEEINNNGNGKTQTEHKITYGDVRDLYCSPAVKRSVWQTIKIVDEIVKAKRNVPEKIFIEVTRDGDDPKRKSKRDGNDLARRKDLETKLKAIKSKEAQELLAELGGKTDAELRQKKLFLYFSQMGKCAYSGESINIEEINNVQLYDIDHIYPRSKTKDDSITRNLVLVKSEYNRTKSNKFLCEFPQWQSGMYKIWQMWRNVGLITREKYERLIRPTPLSDDELGGFIARQIVETSQTVKAIRDLLQRAYPKSKTKVILVKARQVSDFRNMFSNGVRYHNSDQYKILPKLEFIKVRDLNDYHHAKDAYLNIVVGNVMNSTFTDDPRRWIQQRNGKDYTIIPERIFRDSYVYQKENGEESHYPETSGWEYAQSIQLVSDTMKRNDILWTRMSYIESGQIADLQIVGKTQKSEGILPIKQNKRLVQVNKYGGYNSLKGAHFALIECSDKKGATQRKIVSIPQVYKHKVEWYVAKKYSNARIILPVIGFKTLMRFDGFPLHLAGKTGDRLAVHNAKQLVLDEKFNSYVKAVAKAIARDKELRGRDPIDLADNGITIVKNKELMLALCEKLRLYASMPGFTSKAQEIACHCADFGMLSVRDQVYVLYNLIKALKCNAETGDLSSFLPNSSFVGKLTISDNLVSQSRTAILINQSPTGIYEEQLDLKTVRPKPAHKSRKP